MSAKNPVGDTAVVADDWEEDVSGRPKGNKNAFEHGHYTAEAIASRREIAKLLRDSRALVKQVN
jgi:hypothetical protein